jgi:hypothetical protein
MNNLSLVAALAIVSMAAAQKQVVPPQTCGPETVTNGSFEGGSFVPDLNNGGMSLANGAPALSDWNVIVPPYKVGGPGPNKLIWYDNKNQRQTGFNTPFLNRFLNLMGTNPGGLTVAVKQTGIALAPGPYLLQFWVG